MHHNRDAGEFAVAIGRRKLNVSELGFGAFLEGNRFGTQHHMGKVEVPLVRWNIRTLGQVAQIAEITLI
ncbi:MAG: hypothetical protein EBX62_09295, partial [Betaproteobacteria bacterium]|nr:hypothetical protein [Betaproteobacteria bacterium]